MDKATLQGRLDYFTMVHGITRRAIDTFTDQELDFKPTPEMRTTRELIHHIYSGLKTIGEGARDGRVQLEGNEDMGELATVASAGDYAERCFRAARSALSEMSEEEVARTVESPYGAFPAWQFFLFAYDEHWHHRGQLYTYIRLLGKEPPMLYDY